MDKTDVWFEVLWTDRLNRIRRLKNEKFRRF